MLAVLTTLTPALNLGPRLFRPTRSSMVRMQEEVTIAPPKDVVDAVIDSTTNEAPQAQTRFTAVNLNSLDKWAEKFPALEPKLKDIKMSGLIFPFKASPYVIEELIDWEMEGDIGDDPFYRLIFPTMGMLAAHHREKLEAAAATEDPFALKDAVEEIREDLNPHPAGQKELNAGKKGMEDLTGVQHKYAETVLFFASAAQTCHAYCTCAAFPPRITRRPVHLSPSTRPPCSPPPPRSPRRYCFRWAQFIGDSDLRFAQKDAGSLFDYLAKHPEVRRAAADPPLFPEPSTLCPFAPVRRPIPTAARLTPPRHRLAGVRHPLHRRRPDVHEDASDQGVL